MMTALVCILSVGLVITLWRMQEERKERLHLEVEKNIQEQKKALTKAEETVRVSEVKAKEGVADYAKKRDEYLNRLKLVPKSNRPSGTGNENK